MKQLNAKPVTAFGTLGNPSLHESILRCTSGRPHATTAEFSHLTGKAPQTIRKNHSQTGACFGIRPIKVGNTLLWPADAIVRLLGGV